MKPSNRHERRPPRTRHKTVALLLNKTVELLDSMSIGQCPLWGSARLERPASVGPYAYGGGTRDIRESSKVWLFSSIYEESPMSGMGLETVLSWRGRGLKQDTPTNLVLSSPASVAAAQ